MKYRLHLDAKKDLQEATCYYTSVSPSLADDFLVEIENVFPVFSLFPKLDSGGERSQKVPHKSLPLWLDLPKTGRPDFHHGSDAFSSKAGLLGIPRSAMNDTPLETPDVADDGKGEDPEGRSHSPLGANRRDGQQALARNSSRSKPLPS